MTIRATPVRPARALPELARAIRDAKDGDPLAPVSVIVPTNATGVTARRWLGAHGGVAAVDMLTSYRLAEVLAGASLAAEHRRPVSTPVIDITVRRVLADDPGAFAAVADHPSTVVALRELHRELRVARRDATRLLAAASGRGRHAALVSDRVAALLAAEWYDEGDLLRRSIDRIDDGDLSPSLARIVTFLPHPMRGLELDLLRALGERGAVEVLCPHTGDATADAETREFVHRLDATAWPGDGRDGEASVATGVVAPEVVSATDADEEVRHAVRQVLLAASAGTPLDRIAILWPADRPYARLVEHHLAAAELPWNGRPGTAVAERVVPRFLLDLLDVDRRGLRRRDLFDLFADLPIRDASGRYVPTARWERVSRAAGVARDADWDPRLRRYAARERSVGSEAALRRAADADALASFVRELRRTLGRRSTRRTWRDWADWADRQIVHRLGRSFVDSLAVAERQAWDHTNRVLDRLRSLDAISEPVRRSEFRSAFAAEFDVAPGRLGRIGNGVTTGALASAAGLDLGLAIVLGAADGLMPPAPSSGPLIGDAERLAVGLAPSTSVGTRIHRQFLAVVDVADRTVVTFPRGDLRATADRHPSRWLAPHLDELPALDLSSHHAAMLSTALPAHPTEHRLRRRLARVIARGPLQPTDADDDEALGRALNMRAARRSDRITEFDGDLGSLTISHFDRPVAPTQIEQWVACPHAYFARYLLGVRPVEEPGDETQITAAERGNLVHRTLDLFHREIIGGELPQPAPDWTEAHRTRLTELFDAVAGEFAASGRTGREASWAVERSTVLAELGAWLDHDGRRLRARPATVISSEQRFGDDGSVVLQLADGRPLAVRGDIDRVDLAADGELVVVDHKTGSAREYRAISADDPTAGGSRFQLPVYAVGAWSIAGREGPVRAEYSFFGREKFDRIGYSFDDAVWSRVAEDLGHAVAGIESGLFPHRPDIPGFQLFVSCHYCQPDGLGTAERWPEWERKRTDPRGAAWFGDPEEAGA